VTVDAARRFGEGPLSRAAAFVYTLLVVELLFALTTAPGLVLLVLLDSDASNIPLAAACALPVGPALSAALYALHKRCHDLTELHPAAAFWRGYRLNFLGVLRIWAPWLALLAIVGVNLAHLSAANVPAWWAALLAIVGVGALLCAANALVITSLYVFRTVDIARLALYFLGRTPGVTLGNAGLLVASAAVTLLWSEAVLVLLGAAFALVLLHTSRPMTTTIQREFVA
jgi:uncharacterized membrane protein YesL